jgi:thiol-disulfide isomerase/thioredoxin
VKLAAGKVQFIMFFAFWDGASQAMAPLVHGLEERYSEKINFIYLDIDDPATAMLKKALRYRNQPHFFLVDGGGSVLKQWQGYVEIQELIRAIEMAVGR